MSGPTTPALSLCIAVWKRHGAPNISSIVEQLPAAVDGLQTEVIVALNGIGSEEVGVPAGVETVSFSDNLGVPKAWNRAGARAQGRHLCFANDDVELRPQSLRLLHDVLDREPSAGVVGPKGTNWDLSAPRHLDYVGTSGRKLGELVECDVVSGFLFATPEAAFRRSGGFDEAYTPCSFEEVDYCTTVRRCLGLHCYAVAGVGVEHEFGISARSQWARVHFMGRSERVGHIARRNRRYFRRKWGSGETTHALA